MIMLRCMDDGDTQPSVSPVTGPDAPGELTLFSTSQLCKYQNKRLPLVVYLSPGSYTLTLVYYGEESQT